MHTTPVSLLQRLSRPAPEQRDWDRLVELFTPLLYIWARRLGAQEADASDLVQDVLLTLVQKLPEFSYDPDKSFHAWLHTLINNRWRNHCRRRATAQTVEYHDGDLPEQNPVEALSEEEHQQYLSRRALELLKNDFEYSTWKACWETVVNERPIDEVGKELGLSIDAVYTARSRTLRRLREELTGFFD